jgi:hypothetical protein
MFSKHVWYDRRHQAEVFTTDEGVISGTIVAYEGAVFVINPRPEILLALYQEAKIKRILGVKGVILTNNSIEFTRGLCAFVNYSRGLRRRSPLMIITPSGAEIATDFLSSCCAKLWGDSEFEVEFTRLAPGESYGIGKGSIRFVKPKKGKTSLSPYLVVQTDLDRTLHYYDESYNEAYDPQTERRASKPNVVIRAAELPSYIMHVRERLSGEMMNYE